MLDSFERYQIDTTWIARALEALPGSYTGPVRALPGPYGIIGFGEGAWPAEFARAWIDQSVISDGTQFVLAGGLDFGEAEVAAIISEASGSKPFRIGQVAPVAPGQDQDFDEGDDFGIDQVVPASALSTYTYLQALAYATNRAASAEAADTLLRDLCGRCKTDVPTNENPAKRLAWSLWTRTPLLLGTPEHAQQVWAWHVNLARLGKSMSVPLERNPLTVLSSGFEARHEAGDSLVALLIGGQDESLGIAREMLESRVDEVIAVEPEPGEPYASGLGLWYLGAWVGFYLAILYGIDPKDSTALERVRQV
jgi:Phosphoglucose isomerase N-terminal domain/Bacterial phospho-glucose isomerase C-terminal SIS domain